jgi:hypothetical protein
MFVIGLHALIELSIKVQFRGLLHRFKLKVVSVSCSYSTRRRFLTKNELKYVFS